MNPSAGTVAVVGTSTAAPPATTLPPLDPAAKSQAEALLMKSFPGNPPAECKPAGDTMRQQARKQVDLGDEARFAQDMVGAAKDYLAAISMDNCNGFAWLGLGETAYRLGRPDLAVRALRVATSLMPNHTLAWTHLGQQYEALGQRDSAVEAYWKALALAPNIPEARAGLARLGASEKQALPPAPAQNKPEPDGDDW
jgi:tetratricopeptide (TPR) repeat protein